MLYCRACGSKQVFEPGGIIYCLKGDSGKHCDIWIGEPWMAGSAEIDHNRRDPLLQEREKTHGSFAMNAQISQAIKNAMFENSMRPKKPVHRESLEMIALKLSRICSGQANFKDHWDDIAGYAKLGSEACE